MDLKYLTYITAIAKERNISKAAKSLYISQPTLSLYLAKLEDELGLPLFYREGRELYMTPAGQLYVDAANHILETKDELYCKLRNLVSTSPKVISVGIMPQYGGSMFSSVYHDFKELHPNVQLNISGGNCTDFEHLLMKGSIDFAIASTINPFSSKLEYETIQDDEIFLVTSKENPLLAQLKNSSLPLGKEEFQLFAGSSRIASPKGSIRRAAEEVLLSYLQIDPPVLCEMSDFRTLRNMAHDKHSIAFLPKGCLEKDDPQLTALAIPSSPKLYISLIYRKNKTFNDLEQEFIGLVRRWYDDNETYI